MSGIFVECHFADCFTHIVIRRRFIKDMVTNHNKHAWCHWDQNHDAVYSLTRVLGFLHAFCQHAEVQYAEWHNDGAVMLYVNMLSGTVTNVILFSDRTFLRDDQALISKNWLKNIKLPIDNVSCNKKNVTQHNKLS